MVLIDGVRDAFFTRFLWRPGVEPLPSGMRLMCTIHRAVHTGTCGILLLACVSTRGQQREVVGRLAIYSIDIERKREREMERGRGEGEGKRQGEGVG